MCIRDRTDRQTDRQRQRETERQRQTERDRDTETDRQTETETERHTEREGHSTIRTALSVEGALHVTPGAMVAGGVAHTRVVLAVGVSVHAGVGAGRAHVARVTVHAAGRVKGRVAHTATVAVTVARAVGSVAVSAWGPG